MVGAVTASAGAGRDAWRRRARSPCRLRLIGQMEAWTLTSESVLPAGRKTRALLAVIALSAPRPALRGRLAELLWSRRPEEQARASLRQEIHRLLDALSPGGAEVLAVTRDHLSLRPAPSGWTWRRSCGRRPTSRPRCRCSTAICSRIWTASIRPSTPGSPPSGSGCATGPATVAEALLREQVEPEAAIPAAQRCCRSTVRMRAPGAR